MSQLWTPHGDDAAAETPRTDEEAMATLESLRSELADADPAVVVANHCYGLFELAAVYLSLTPPRLDAAQLAIDALGILTDGLGSRLGAAAPELADALAQLRLAFVQLHASSQQPDPAS